MNITPAYKLAVVAILFSYCKHNLRNDKKKKLKILTPVIANIYIIQVSVSN